MLINQLIEKEMREQNQQQRVKFQEIKDRTAAIRARYEEQQRRGSFGAFTPHTYAQGNSAVGGCQLSFFYHYNQRMWWLLLFYL